MADIALQTITDSGLIATYGAAAAGGDAYLNDGNTFYHVKNGGGAAVVVTLASQVNPAHPGEAIANKVVTVGAGAEKMIGPSNQAAFNDAAGKVQITYDQVTSVTVAALKLGPN